MPTTDKWGQGIQLWQMTDAPDIPAAIKAVADGVIPRGVLRFTSSSSRGATLVGDYAPIDGMLTWLDDVKRLELRVDGAWVVIAVGTRSWTTISLATGWTHNGNLNGTFQYRVINEAGEETIQFRGGIERTSYPSTVPASWILTTSPLPSAARPSSKRTLTVPCSDISSDRITLKMDVQTDGHLSLWGTGSSVKPPWVGFNGVYTSL